jgi:hypothetical protein
VWASEGSNVLLVLSRMDDALVGWKSITFIQANYFQLYNIKIIKTSVLDTVVDPEPHPDPNVLGPSGSASRSVSHKSSSKNSKKF